MKDLTAKLDQPFYFHAPEVILVPAKPDLKPDLHVLLGKWQKILRLQDWDLQIKYVQAYELDANTGGQVIRCDAKKTGRIKVLDPDCYDPCLIVEQDAEYTVVHELVHVHFAIIDGFEGAKDTLYEQAVHRIAKSFIAMDRKLV